MSAHQVQKSAKKVLIIKISVLHSYINTKNKKAY